MCISLAYISEHDEHDVFIEKKRKNEKKSIHTYENRMSVIYLMY